MELRAIKESIMLVVGRLENLEQSGDAQASANGSVGQLRQCKNMVEFREEEEKLTNRSYMKLKVIITL